MAAVVTADFDSREKRRSFTIAVVVVLVCLVGVGIYAWWMLRGSEMSTVGVVVLAIGILVTLGLGVGLMSLVYYSNRAGYDDRAKGADET